MNSKVLSYKINKFLVTVRRIKEDSAVRDMAVNPARHTVSAQPGAYPSIALQNEVLSFASFTRVGIPYTAYSYHGWLCCWSRPSTECFSPDFRVFPSSTKNNISWMLIHTTRKSGWRATLRICHWKKNIFKIQFNLIFILCVDV